MLILMAMTGGWFTFPEIIGPTAVMARCAYQDPARCGSSYSHTAGGMRYAAGGTALRAAMEMIGVPYSWGGGGAHGPSRGVGRGAGTRGFDCSGLAQYAWASAGVLIGRTTRQQWSQGTRVPRKRLRPGDLVFYDSNPRQQGPEHVGLAVDAERMVNAPFTGASVRVESLDRPTFLGVVRPGG
jgi:cell wall-associated NlpC family hydrolase